MNSGKLYAWALLTIGLGLLVSSTLIFMDASNDDKIENKIVPCYDKWNNKIIGAQCEDKGQQDLYIASGMWLTMVGIIITYASSKLFQEEYFRNRMN